VGNYPLTVLNRPSVEELRRLFSYDPETGILYWSISPVNSIHVGDIAGSIYRVAILSIDKLKLIVSLTKFI
jgi:hypothetical protein